MLLRWRKKKKTQGAPVLLRSTHANWQLHISQLSSFGGCSREVCSTQSWHFTRRRNVRVRIDFNHQGREHIWVILRFVWCMQAPPRCVIISSWYMGLWAAHNTASGSENAGSVWFYKLWCCMLICGTKYKTRAEINLGNCIFEVVALIMSNYMQWGHNAAAWFWSSSRLTYTNPSFNTSASTVAGDVCSACWTIQFSLWIPISRPGGRGKKKKGLTFEDQKEARKNSSA